jgi:8-oxo-dGTP diphosphatase
MVTNGQPFERSTGMAAYPHEPGSATVTIIDKIAWIYLENGAILSSRSRGKDVYYIPGGKREPGEGDMDTLVREIREELSVTIAAGSVQHLGTFQAQAHGHRVGTLVRMTCYTAEYQGVLQPNSEVEEITWLTHSDRDRVSPVDQIIFDHLHATARLR